MDKDLEAIKEQLHNELLGSMKACQVKYTKQTELATEGDVRVSSLCTSIEQILSHGISHEKKLNSVSLSNANAIRQVTDYVSSGLQKSLSSGDLKINQTQGLWQFLLQVLTPHECARFSRLKRVTCSQGRVRAWIRSTLNEHSLERYLKMILGEISLVSRWYEPWAYIRDEKRSSDLPQLVTRLGGIFFALIIDRRELCLDCCECSDKGVIERSTNSHIHSRASHLLAALPKGKSVKNHGASINKIESRKKKKVPSKVVSFDENTNRRKSPFENSTPTASISSESTSSSSPSAPISTPVELPSTPYWVHSAPTTCLNSPTLVNSELDDLNHLMSLLDGKVETSGFEVPQIDENPPLERRVSYQESSYNEVLEELLNAHAGVLDSPDDNTILGVETGSERETDQTKEKETEINSIQKIRSPNNSVSSAVSSEMENYYLDKLSHSSIAGEINSKSPIENVIPESSIYGAEPIVPSENVLVPSNSEVTPIVPSHNVLVPSNTPFIPSDNMLVPSNNEVTGLKSHSPSLSSISELSGGENKHLLSVQDSNSNQSVSPSDFSIHEHSTLSPDELRQALHVLAKAKETVDSRYKEVLVREEGMKRTIEELERSLEEQRKLRCEEKKENSMAAETLKSENALLRKQLGKYISAVQLLKVNKKDFKDEDSTRISGEDHTLDEMLPDGEIEANATDGDEAFEFNTSEVREMLSPDGSVMIKPRSQPLPPRPENIDYHTEALAYESKLIQVAEMHGELFEFSEKLQRLLRIRESQVTAMQRELIALRGHSAKDKVLEGVINSMQCNSDDTDTVSLCSTIDTGASLDTLSPVTLWIPSARLVGENEPHHEYDVYIRIRDDEWKVQRRFTLFHQLHKQLCKAYPEVKALHFPHKKPFGYREESVVQQRRLLLQEYLRLAISILIKSNPQLAVHTDKSTLTTLMPFLSDGTLEGGTQSGSLLRYQGL